MIPEFKDVLRTEYDVVIDEPKRVVKSGDNWGFAALFFAIIVGVVGWLAHSFLAGCLVVAFAFAVMALLLNEFKSTWFKRDKVIPAIGRRVPRTVVENKQVAEHRCCIHCRHPAKVLR